MHRTLYGGIEAGGTKFVCGVGSGSGELVDRIVIPTTDAGETLEDVIRFFKSHPTIASVGLGCFGPIDVNPKSKSYGTILQTPKKGFQNLNIKQILETELQKPLTIATDTDVAAIGEYYYGKVQHCNHLLYLTIGTGIGGTILTNGLPAHGYTHPEMGHMLLPALQNSFAKGACRYHANCFEGFASGKSIELLTKSRAEDITNRTFWKHQAQYIAMGLMNIVLIYQPELIVLGGSVVQKSGLIYDVQCQLLTYINSYTPLPSTKNYIIHSSSDSIGILGAIKLASLAH